MSRDARKEIFPLLKELGIAVTAYSVLSRGLLSGTVPQAGRAIPRQFAAVTGGNLERSRKLVEALGDRPGKTHDDFAARDRLVLAQGSNIIPGRRLVQARAARGSVGRARDQALRRRSDTHERAVPAEAVAGTRYDEHQVKRWVASGRSVSELTRHQMWW